MYDKKGALELSVNVVFAGLIGVVVFILALSFIMSNMQSADKERKAEFANSFVGALRASYEEDYFSNIISFTEQSSIRVECKDLFFDDEAASLTDMIVFSPSEFSTTQLGTSSERIEMPFYISNAFYLYPQLNIFLYCEDCDSTSDIPEIYALLSSLWDSPTLITGEEFAGIHIIGQGDSMTLNQISQEEDKKKIIVVLENESEGFNYNFNYKNLSFNENLFDTDSILVGNISYNNEIYPFIGEEMLFGAILSDDLDTYKCNVEKFFEMFNSTLRVYEERYSLMSGNPSYPSSCLTLESLTTQAFSNLKEEITNANNNLDYESFYDLAVSINYLEEVARYAEMESCPSLY
ncbi:MAG: hypothetical protein PWR30_243 [Candidatus Woesearchaeota archaeon]|nr:hypothetical protein [Candidatus Woesearchaeota archaeon]